MNESQIAEAVRSAVDDATAGLTARPDAAQRARRQGRRRRTVRGLLAGVPAIALAGAGAAFALHGSGTTGTRPDVLTAAYVTRHAEAALGQAGHYIVRTSFQELGVSYITLFDLATGNEWKEIKPTGSKAVFHSTIFEWGQQYPAASSPHWTFTVTDMSNRTWYRDTLPELVAGMKGVKPNAALDLSEFTSPKQIKRALSSGEVTIAGKGTVNGQAAIELQLAAKHTHFDYWVNAQTYHPVEIVVGSGHAIDIDWLRRTEALVRKVNTPQIPAGFRHVSAPTQH